MVFKKSAWVIARKILAGYVHKNKAISGCYIRHSAAFGPQNPFLSDLDITFFVAASNIDGLREIHKQINRDFRKKYILKHFIKDIIILPGTKNAYGLCERYYPLRSVYPASTWLPLDQEPRFRPVAGKYPLPLDHAPESFLSSYLIPVLKGERRHHIFEGILIARKIKGDCSRKKMNQAQKKFWSTYEALSAEINIWNEFYKEIRFFDLRQKVTVLFSGWPQDKQLQEYWNNARKSFKGSKGIVSLWAYPSSHFDATFNLSLNSDPTISPESCKKNIVEVCKVFKGLDYTLLLGTEASMLGRINGLSRVSLLEPWLFKYQGVCLLGDPMVREKIIEPSMDMLKQKYLEFLLYISYRFLYKGSYPYALYRLCFTLDHLFKHNTLILDAAKLAEIYREEFIPEQSFTPLADTSKLLSSLKEKHGFDLFGEN